MTVPAQGFSGPTYIQTPGNGVATTYSFPFMITAATDLIVGFIVAGVYTQQLNGYTVSGIGNVGGGQVAFLIPPAIASLVDLRSLIPETQPTNFSNLGAYYPEATTQAVDRAVRQIADLYRLTYLFGVHGPDQEATIWPALPPAAARAGTGLIFDNNGLPALGVIPTTVFTQALWDSFLNATSALVPLLGLQLTLAEQLAGLTLVNPYYRPGYLLRYGLITDAAVDGSSGFDNSSLITKALAMSATYGIPIYAPYGNIGISNVIQAGGSNLIIDGGIHQTQWVVLQGTSGIVWTDNGSSAKTNIRGGLAIYGTGSVGVLRGFYMGYGTPDGTEAYFEQVWVRDLPNAIGIDVNANIGENGFFISQNTQGLNYIGTGSASIDIECVGASGFMINGALHAVNLGDVTVGLLEIEAPASGVIPLSLSGDAQIDMPVISFGPGTTHDRVISVGVSASSAMINLLKYYFAQGGAWKATINYAVDNLVSFASVQYFCIAPNINQQPPNATYWRLSPNIVGPADFFDVGTSAYYGGLCEGGSHQSEGTYPLSKGGATGLFSIGSLLKGTQVVSGTTTPVALTLLMPNSTYNIQLTPRGDPGGSVWPSNPTPNGFNINTKLAWAGSVDWRVEP